MKRFSRIFLFSVLAVVAITCIVRWDDIFPARIDYERAPSLPHVWCSDTTDFLIFAEPSLETQLRLPEAFPAYQPIDSVPINGSERFQGRSYYIDYPSLRLVYLDVEQLHTLSSYLTLNTWLNQTLRFDSTALCDHTAPNNRWTIVLMSRSVRPAAMQHSNPLLYTFFNRTLLYADLVIAGGDRSYSRQRYHNIKHIISSDIAEWTTPVLVNTSATEESLLPSCNSSLERIGANRPFVSRLHITHDTLFFCTDILTADACLAYDSLTFIRANRLASSTSILQSWLTSNSHHHFFSSVLEADSLPAEEIALPENYAEASNLFVRRFYNRLESRKRVKSIAQP